MRRATTRVRNRFHRLTTHKETAKAIAAYNMVSNLGDDIISMTEAHLIKNNDTARQFYVGKDMLEHQADMADAYIDSMSTEEEN